jgi:hypothetical protein
MEGAMNGKSGLVTWTIIGTIAQVAMVVAGHFNPAIAQLFAIVGVSISALAGLGYALRTATPSTGRAALGGAIVGGVCALLGIALSFGLGDVTAFILLAGTGSSAVGGAIGGAIGRAAGGRKTVLA